MIKYLQLAFELRERRPGYDITIVPVVLCYLGGSIKEVLRNVGRVFWECLEREQLIEIKVAEM